MTDRNQLTETDHNNLDAFLEHALNDVKDGHISDDGH